jgi:cyclopropane fatty-acyl-phospholipid synthase-like methyltransferase
VVVPISGRYAAMRWNTPLSEAHADLLIERLDVGSARSVLDVGCGWGELLLRVVEAATEGCVGVGVDTEDGLLDRGRRAAAARGLAESVEFVGRRAQDWDQPADRVLCVGSSHALGGSASALAALRPLVTPGGRLLFGDGCWEGESTPEALAIFGDDVLALDRVLDHARDAGWRMLSLSTADQREWDEFESSYRRGSEEWLLANPSAPDAPAVRHDLDRRLTEYETGYRGVLGFCYLVLTLPSA